MAKVKMLTSMAGIDFVHNVGDEIEVTDDQAVRYIAAGIAEAVDERKVETAVKKIVTRKAAKE